MQFRATKQQQHRHQQQQQNQVKGTMAQLAVGTTVNLLGVSDAHSGFFSPLVAATKTSSRCCCTTRTLDTVEDEAAHEAWRQLDLQT